MSAGALPVLWLNGPDGVGKSTVGFEIFRRLADAGVKTAYLDLDQVGLCHPTPEDDPDNHRVKAANLAALWSIYRDEGARCMVISGVVESGHVIQAHADLIPDASLTLVRLRAAREELRARFVGRGGHVQDAADIVGLAEELDRSDIGGVCVDTDGLSPVETARRVLAATGGWPWLP